MRYFFTKILFLLKKVIQIFFETNHSTLFKLSGVSTRVGTSYSCVVFPDTSYFKTACCLGPNCWIISGNNYLIVFVYGSPDMIKVLF